MTLPARHLELVDRTWEALHDGRYNGQVALVSKGPVCDIVEGLSDIDLRAVLNTRSADCWRWANDVIFRAFKAFAYDFPDDWRIVEHLPGRGFALDELHCCAARSEHLEWDVLREDVPGMVPLLTELDDDLRGMYLQKFIGYRDPYDATRDPPINVAHQHRERFPLFSICWHYYAPALRCAALASGAGVIRNKWDALRWRADTGSATARRVLEVAEADFVGPADDLAALCTDDIQGLARELATGDDPWRAIEEQVAESQPNRQECLWLVVVSGRMATGRWRFYIEAPEGYDLPVVLRVDRGHLKNYLIGPLLHDDGPAKMLAHAPDPEAHQRSMKFLVDQMSATDFSNPRDVFREMARHYERVRKAIEAWYEDVA